MTTTPPDPSKAPGRRPADPASPDPASPSAEPPGRRQRLWRTSRYVWERLRTWRRAAEFSLAKKFGVATAEDRTFLLLIGVVGVLAGGLGVAVHRLVDLLQRLLWGGDNLLDAAVAASPEKLVGTLALGGGLLGLLVILTGRPAAGPGMSILIEAVALRGGRLPLKSILVGSLGSILTVGSGGSLGREGPMIRLGAMLSSRLGVRLRLPPHRVKILVGCGAAAGLAAAYNIPIGGAVFAMEVVLGNFALQIFGPIVASSVLSTLIARAFEGDAHRFAAPGFRMESGWEVLTYAGLGLVAALVSIVFVLWVRWFGGWLRGLPIPEALRPILGFSALGGLAILMPLVLGGGREGASLLLSGGLELDDSSMPLPVLLLLIAAVKLVAVGLTSGSGGSGGQFTPSLFVGALVGGAYGWVVHALWPEATAGYGAYAAVGMAAIMAGTSHAPISAILILFEFTGNYELVLPVMVASITSSVISRKLYPYSIYTESLQRKGVDLNMRLEEAVLAGMSVGDLTREDTETLSPAEGYRQVVDRFFASHRGRLFVVGDDERLLGEVSLHDIKHVLEEPGLLTAVVAYDLLRPAEPVLRFGESLHRAAAVFARSDSERLPVVDDEGRFQGVVTKRDLLAIYAQEVLGRPALLATFVSSHEDDAKGQGQRDYVELPPDFAVRLVDLPTELEGKTLAEARLPQELGLRVLELKRGEGPNEERVIPGAETVFREGDRLILLGPLAALELLETTTAAAEREAS